MGIGAIAFNFEPVYSLKGRIDSYKEGIANCTEPIGQFKNDNVMITNSVICLADRDRARDIALRHYRGYLYSLVCLYHDTMPKPDYAPTWPESIPGVADLDALDRLIAEGWLLCGNPEEVAEQVGKYQSVGCDQVVFGLPSDSMEHEEVLEMLEVFGTKVIPEFDKDEVHSTTRYRATAQRKYPDFAFDVPDVGGAGPTHQCPHPAGRHPQAVGPRTAVRSRWWGGTTAGRALGRCAYVVRQVADSPPGPLPWNVPPLRSGGRRPGRKELVGAGHGGDQGKGVVEDGIGIPGGDAGHRVAGDHDLVAEVAGLDGQAEHAQVDRDPGGHDRGDAQAA